MLDNPISELFQKTASTFPNNIALVRGSVGVTYKELYRSVMRLAERLSDSRIKPRDRIAIVMQNSPTLITGILAILKVGCCYVPIRPDTPLTRMRFLLEDSQCSAVLADPFHEQAFKALGLTHIDLDACCSLHVSQSKTDTVVGPVREATDIAYIMYTSGTTGQPKGCVISHRNVVSLFDSTQTLFDFHDQDVWILSHSYCFDFSVWEIFGALLYGAKLVIPDGHVLRNPRRFLEMIKRHRVSVLNQTPGAFSRLAQEEIGCNDRTLHKHLRYIIFGGDRLDLRRLMAWHDKYPSAEISLINMYGITETTVHSTYHKIQDTDFNSSLDRSLIGTPLSNSHILLLNDEGMPVDANECGEIYVSSPGVGLGYLNRSELTIQKFIRHPLLPGVVVYRTGDIGRYLDSGVLEYIGRYDEQVKIRGHRIEMGEIRQQFLMLDMVDDAYVIPNEARTAIIAYVIPCQRASKFEIMEALKSRLPSYMIPNRVVLVNQFPITSNGKVDKRALLQRREGVQRHRTGLDEGLAHYETFQIVWETVFGTQSLDMSADFFECGGNSVDAYGLVVELRKYGLSLDLEDIFSERTLAAICQKLKPMVRLESHVNDTARLTEQYPATYFQRKYIDAFYQQPSSCHGIQIDSFEIRGPVDLVRLQSCIQCVIGRHPIIMSEVSKHDNLGYRISASTNRSIDIAIHTYHRSHEFESEIAAAIARELATPFNLETDPLIRINILRDDAGRHQLLFTFHHILVDKQSMDIFINEILLAYMGGQSNNDGHRGSFSHYANREHAIVRRRNSAAVRYWLDQYEKSRQGLVSSLNYGDNRGVNQVYVDLDGTTTELITEYCNSHAVTRSMWFIAVYFRFLYGIYPQNALTVGVTMSTRKQRDEADVIGPFINHAILYLDLQSQTTWSEQLSRIRRDVLQYYKYPDLPIGYVSELFSKRHTQIEYTRHFDFLVNYHGKSQHEYLIDDSITFRRGDMPSKNTMTRCMTLGIFENQDGIRCFISYRRSCVNVSVESTLGSRFVDAVRAAVVA